MYKTKKLLTLAVGFLCAVVWGESSKTVSITQTTTVISKTVVTEKKQWSPFKVCVMDFTSLDILGQKRFLDEKNNPITVPPQCT